MSIFSRRSAASTSASDARRMPTWRRELWLLAAATLASYGMAVALDLHESAFEWFARHERWQIDELPLTLVVFTTGLAWYAMRRRRESSIELGLRQQAEARASELLRHNRELAQQMISVQESERLSLARELHDEIGQTCTAIRFETAYLRACAAGDTQAMLDAAARADTAAYELQRGVRELLRRLRPANLDELGLLAALEELCQSWQQRSSVSCAFSHAGLNEDADTSLGAVVDISLYRVTQEALTNVARHAQARSVSVHVCRAADGELSLSIRDDGVGMNPSATTRGLGLLGATERAAGLGGALDVQSRLGHGVCLTLRVPAAACGQQPLPVPSTASAAVSARLSRPAAAAMARESLVLERAP